MKKIVNNYKSSIIMIISLIIGTIIGLIFKENASVLSPFGDLFLNLLLVIIIPLLFVTISLAIAKMDKLSRVKKIIIAVLFVFLITSIINASIALITTKNITLVSSNNIVNNLEEINTSNEELNLLSRTVNMISVSDFSKLLSRDNMIALIVFSLIIGICINKKKEESSKIIELLESLNNIIEEYLHIVMYYAPFGLGCYIASLVGSFGKDMIIGYTKVFVVYTLLSLVIYFVVYSIYTYIGGGKSKLKKYWANIIPPSITALSTCSSAASMPVNIEYTSKMGTSKDIVDTTVSLGTSFHKDGSTIGSVFKIMFLVQLLNLNIPTSKIILIALLATLLVSAVPIGGGTISESLIITMLGVNPAYLGVLTIIATIIDAPATVLNVVGDSSASILVSKIINKKK